MITLMDTHAAPVALIFICFIEAIAVSWFYGKSVLKIFFHEKKTSSLYIVVIMLKLLSKSVELNL